MATTTSTTASTTATSWDAIVVGAGHNGLTAAAYIARAGLRVLVLEARDVVGGAAVTEPLGGARVPTLAHTVGRLRPSVARELDLARWGLALVAPEVRVFAPQPDGRAVTLWADLGKSVDAIRTWSEDDATSFVEFDRSVRSLSKFLADLGDEAPPDIKAPGFGDALLGLRLGRAFRGLGKDDGRTILRVLAMAAADFVAESFSSEAVRATLAWRGVRYTAMGPWSAGSTQVLLADAAGNDGGAAGETVFAKGGPSALSEALASAARAAGAEIRTGARVVSVTTADGVVTGVALASGEEIATRAVVSGLDPKQLLTQLVDPVTVGPSMRWRAGNIRTPGSVAKVNLVLDGLPEFPAAGRRPPPAARPDPGEHHLDRRDGARLRRVQVRADLRGAGARGDDPVPGGPVARGRRTGGHAGHERADAVDAGRARRRGLGVAARGGRGPGRADAGDRGPGARFPSHGQAGARLRRTSRANTGSRAATRSTRSRRSTRSSCGGRSSAGLATGCRSRACTSRARGRTRAAASPAPRAGTRPRR